MRGIGSSGRCIPAVAASVPAHGPAAFTTTGAEMAPSLVRTPVTTASSVSISTTSTPRSTSAPERRASVAYPCVSPAGSAIPSSAQNDAPTTSSIAMPGTMAAASSGVRSCVSTPSARCSSAPARKSAQSCSSRTRNRYPSCTTSSGNPCSSENPRIIGTLASDSSMLMRLENWWRNPPAHAPVEPVATLSARSRRTTRSTPAAARWYAVLAPTTPPPTTTTSAVSVILVPWVRPPPRVPRSDPRTPTPRT